MRSRKGGNSARLAGGRASDFRSAGVPPALLKYGSLRRPAFIGFVGRGFSRDIKNRLSQTFLSAAFSPNLRLVARAPRTFRARVRSTASVGRNSRPSSSSDTISNRFWSKSRSNRKHTVKPRLTGSRIAHIHIGKKAGGRAFGFRSAGVPPALSKFGSLRRPPFTSPGGNSAGWSQLPRPNSCLALGTSEDAPPISNRNKPKYRSHRKHTTKPCLTGARTACQAIAPRSAT